MKKTKSGLLYKIISDNKNPVVKKGDFVRISYQEKVRDSVLFSSATTMPAFVRIDSVSPASYSAMEVFPMLRKGDSAVVIQLGDSLQRKSGQALPPFIHKKDKLILTLRVENVYNNEQDMIKDRVAALESFHQKQISNIEEYLKKNNIEATKTAKGTFVKITSPGDGPTVDSGKQVSVIYTGKLYPSGKTFESNEEAGKEPVKVIIGRHMVIPGWEDGLAQLKKGATATFYIPAFLAYDQQPGPGRTPNENLIFDVKVVDVTDAPKEEPVPSRSMTPARPNVKKEQTPAKK